jgi:hypothetical protein
MEQENAVFQYNYSAKQQDEVERIRRKYLTAEQTEQEDKMARLRRLDRSTTELGGIVALTLGIVSTLVLGFGMCCTMVWADRLFVPGVLIGIVGLAGIGAAYPVYKHITARQREKISSEILQLTEELSKN